MNPAVLADAGLFTLGAAMLGWLWAGYFNGRYKD